jgi:chromosomal replication initiation ATPase DnaA
MECKYTLDQTSEMKPNEQVPFLGLGHKVEVERKRLIKKYNLEDNLFPFDACIVLMRECVSEYNPIYIYGKNGIEKSNFLKAIKEYSKIENINMKYITTRLFIKQYSDLTQSNIENIRGNYIIPNILIIDNIELFIKYSDALYFFISILKKRIILKKSTIIIGNQMYPKFGISLYILKSSLKGLVIGLVDKKYGKQELD